VSRAPGATAVIVRVGELEARARISVVQHPVELQLADTAVWVEEGERERVSVIVGDGRGHPVTGAVVRWETADAGIAEVDAEGNVTGVTPGRSALTATFGQLRAAFPVVVVPVAASITVAAGEDQRGPAGRPLAVPVSAQVVSRSGRPMPGVPASFVAHRGIGLTLPEVDTSDARGMVQTLWTLGPVPGRQQITIAVEGVPVWPMVSAEADPIPANTRVSLVGEEPAAGVGDSVPDPVIIRVTDSTGIAIPDVPVAWRTGDGGTVMPLGDRTDSLGEARARWVLGPRAGRQVLRAQVGNMRLMPAFLVAATARPADAVGLVLRAGDRQTGTVGKTLRQPVILRAVDAHGNPVPGVTVTVSVTSGAASDSLLSTDSTGHGRVRWTLGTAVGAQHLRAHMRGAKSSLEVSARALPAGPSRLTFIAPPAAGLAGQLLPKPIVAELSDTHGNPLVKRTIVFTSSNGSVSPIRVVTDSTGRVRVRWKLGKKSGPAKLTARVPGSPVQQDLEIPAKGR
jgi:adhesin/invasin